jgi:hypothetical protein
MGRNQLTSTNFNQSNYIGNNMSSSGDLLSELIKVRRGEQSALINSLLPANSLIASMETGSNQLRSTSNFITAQNLALGNFNSVVSTLATTNGILQPTGIAGLTTANTSGLVARAGCLPEHRATSGTLSTPCIEGVPYNYFATNPRYGTALMYYNGVSTNYHSMQTQVTLRPTNGVSFQATWTWSRALSDSGWTNYLSDRDYLLTGQHRSHTLNTYGSWELPFGAKGLLFRDASGAFKKVIEGWQLNWITSMSTGAPLSVTGQASMWGNSWPILMRPDLWDNKAGKATYTWDDGAYRGGRYLGSKYTKVMDTNICSLDKIMPIAYNAYCSSLIDSRTGNTFPNGTAASDYATYGVLNIDSNTGVAVPLSTAPRALALASGKTDDSGAMTPMLYTKADDGTLLADGTTAVAGQPIVVFRNADQTMGVNNQKGIYKANQLTGQGRFSFDLAMSKSIEFMEGKRLEIRVDAQNILNHATPTNGTSASNGGRFYTVNSPSFAINGTGTVGTMSTKAGHRTFQARLRLSF